MTPEVANSLTRPSARIRTPVRAAVPSRRSDDRRRYLPLLQRLAGVNVLLMLAAVAVTVVVLAPRKLSSFAIDAEVLAVIGAVTLVVLANVYLLRRLVGPVQALTALTRRVDLTSPSERMPAARSVPGRAAEAKRWI